MDDYDGKKTPVPVDLTAFSSFPQQPPSPRRPPINYSSPAAFFQSVGARWRSVWTKRFILSLVFGQIVSLCITCTNVTTTELVNRGLSLPTMQNNFLYFSLFVIFTPYTMYKYGLKGWGQLVLRDGWRYFILAASDVEGNFLAVKAYSYTDLLSCMLLDAWAIPVCLLFSWVYMRPKYHWTQILGVLICSGGLGLLVTCDVLTGKNWQAVSKGKGDAFMVAAATFYGFTNATEEFFVRKRPLYEVVGQLGMWGFIINGIQASALEHELIRNGNWNGATVGLLLAYTGAMLILYTVAPLLYRLASSAYYNLSLLSSDFYGLLFGLFLFHYRPFWLYFISFAVVIVGLITYFWSSAPEEQGFLDPQAPAYIPGVRGEEEENAVQDIDGEEVVVPSLERVAVVAGTVVTNDAPDHHPALMAPQGSPILRQSRPPMRHANPVVAFIIGLSIILLASILNAAGLNLTKLDHVRSSAIPKASRRKDWMRPLWLLGMILYILSQLIGSTLALEYMRAEYVAPLGSSSLIFNFLFARFLVGTPVTRNDIYGTIVVVLGVVGIVAFGSINSGLTSEIDAARLSSLWGRLGWLGYFFAMTFALILLLIFITRLEAVLSARNEITPGSENNSSQKLPTSPTCGSVGRAAKALRSYWRSTMIWITEKLEAWTGPKPDQQIAWTLGIGWACCGGGLAGGCLVFAKASVKLVSGSLSRENTGNQFGHVSVIFTFILLVVTAVMQIICLNKGLKVYDSTLVVPVFYSVYTVTGFLDSLVFNNEIDAYEGWTLFLVFLSILVLIAGVVLLTHKKPEPAEAKVKSATIARPRTATSARPRTAMSARPRTATNKPPGPKDDLESQGEAGDGDRDNEQDVLWEVGHASDDDDQGEDEDIDHHQHPLYRDDDDGQQKRRSRTNIEGEDGIELVPSNDESQRRSSHSLIVA